MVSIPSESPWLFSVCHLVPRLVGLSMGSRQLMWPWDPGLMPGEQFSSTCLGQGQSGHHVWCGQGVNQQSQSCELFSIHRQRWLLVKAGRQSRTINGIPSVFCLVVWKFVQESGKVFFQFQKIS